MSTALLPANDSILAITVMERTEVQKGNVLIFEKSGNRMASKGLSGKLMSKFGPILKFLPKKLRVCGSKKLKTNTKGIDKINNHKGAGMR